MVNIIEACGRNNMKLAVCYSGLIRNLFDVMDSNKKHLLDLYDCDVFFHFWDVFGKTELGWLEETKVNDTVDKFTQDTIVSILKPKKFQFENLENKSVQIDSIASKYDQKIINYNAKNSLSMFYSIQQAHSKLIEYIQDTNTQYDAVVRIRSDLVFSQDVRINKVSDDTLIIPAVNGFPINDHFGYGTLNTMNVYSGVFYRMRTKYTNPHPETSLFEQLVENNIKIYKDDSIKYKMMRTQRDGTLVLRGDD